MQLKSLCRLLSWNEQNKMEKQTSSVPKSGIKPPERLKSDIFSLDFCVCGGGGGGGGGVRGVGTGRGEERRSYFLVYPGDL